MSELNNEHYLEIARENLSLRKHEIELKELELRLTNDIDFNNRQIDLMSSVDESTAETVIKGLKYLESKDHNEPITINICTEGGCTYSMFSMYDSIRASRCPIYTRCSGMVMSAGILIAAAGDRGHRTATENCQFMFHVGQSGIDDEHQNAEATMQHYKKFKDLMVKEIASRSKKTLTFWREQEKKVVDQYFSSSQALSWGLIDKIIRPFKHD